MNAGTRHGDSSLGLSFSICTVRKLFPGRQARGQNSGCPSEAHVLRCLSACSQLRATQAWARPQPVLIKGLGLLQPQLAPSKGRGGDTGWLVGSHPKPSCREKGVVLTQLLAARPGVPGHPACQMGQRQKGLGGARVMPRRSPCYRRCCRCCHSGGQHALEKLQRGQASQGSWGGTAADEGGLFFSSCLLPARC